MILKKLTYYLKLLLLSTSLCSLGIAMSQEVKEYEKNENKEVEIEWFQKTTSATSGVVTHYSNGEKHHYHYIAFIDANNSIEYFPQLRKRIFLQHCQLIYYN